MCMSTSHSEHATPSPLGPTDNGSEVLNTSTAPHTAFTEFLNTPHVPDDAGIHSAALGRILGRIPDGWGRWISCGAGWYGLLVDLDERIAAVAPDYHVHQVKEKFGTLRFYWSLPDLQPACCVERAELDPCPHRAVPSQRDDLPATVVNEFDAWCAREREHLESPDHTAAEAALDASGVYSRRELLASKIGELVAAAERAAAQTCELCGSHGELHEAAGWYKTLCVQCAHIAGYQPV